VDRGVVERAGDGGRQVLTKLGVQPAAGMSIETGMAVCAVIASGTRRARAMTADDSTAWSKMGPVMDAGRSVLLMLERLVAMMG
jgi:hypothetical protein